MTVQEHAKALDIWDIVKQYVNYSEDWAVDDVVLHLDSMDIDQSYVDVRYYDLQKPSEEVCLKRFNITSEALYKMHRDIELLVDLPNAVMQLHVRLNANEVVRFQVMYAPLLKV
jgi:hypothetical protein